MKTIQIASTTALAVALWASIGTLMAEPFLYVSDGGARQLVKVDVGAGTTKVIGPLNQPGAYAMAVSPQGRLYTVTQGWPPGGVNPALASVDLKTGNAVPFGANLNPEIFMGIGFSPKGELYGVNAASGTVDAGSLYRFDPQTGEADKVHVTGSCGSIMDVAWHPDGTMYGADPTSLYRINPNTGEATLLVTTTRTRIMGLAIDDDGNFYVTEIVADAPLLRLDPATGATTPVPGVTLSFPHGLEFIPTPRSLPVTLAFGFSQATSGHWSGSVDMDSDGVPDGTIVYHQGSGEPRVAGPTVHSEGDVTVETAFYSFTAHLQVLRNQNRESLRGHGEVTEGWLDGARVYLKAEHISGGVEGILRIMPGCRN